MTNKNCPTFMQYVTCIQIRNITSIKVKRWDVIKMPKIGL